jgi:cytoskeleton protein RodZ
MKTESKQPEESAPLSVGTKLRLAREKLGLSQKDIADHLCLRQITIRDIEEDQNSAGLASTFVRGYIRAYARYVNLPEEEVSQPLIDNSSSPSQTFAKREFKSASVKGFPLNKSTTHKKRDSWLMLITWIILLGVIGLSGVWWWQNYKLDNRAIDELDVSSTIKLNEAKIQGRLVLSDDNGSGSNVIVLPSKAMSQPFQSASTDTIKLNDSISPSALFQQRQPLFPNPKASLTAEAIAQLKILSNTINMRFQDKSWVTITHRVNGRTETLFSGQKNKGETLEVSGTPPYRITLGKPEAVKLEFGGKQVATQSRFTLNAAQ